MSLIAHLDVFNVTIYSYSILDSKSKAMISFGSDRIYIKKYIENPRHMEVQVLANDSKIIQLGERERSVQRRHQKLIEEMPSPALEFCSFLWNHHKIHSA
jgi:acetyl/propionyl-CoA carboxylase alpha subunit